MCCWKRRLCPFVIIIFIIFVSLITGCIMFHPFFVKPNIQYEDSFIPDVPESSMIKLIELANVIASTNCMKIKSVEFVYTWGHPNETPGAIIHFLEKEIEPGVYEFVSQFFRNKNWSSVFEQKSKNQDSYEYPGNLGPASTVWMAKGEIYKSKCIKVNVGTQDVFITIGSGIDTKRALLYTEKFIDWAKTNPTDFTNELKDISGVDIDLDNTNKYAEKISFSFYKNLRSNVYRFKITNAHLVYDGSDIIMR